MHAWRRMWRMWRRRCSATWRPALHCRVGGGAPQGWPPSAAQTAPYGFPVSRFHKGVSSRVQGRNQRNQSYKPVFANQLTLRELFPAGVAPSLVTMRPDASHNPAVKLVEEPTDMGLTVVLAPPTNDRVYLVNQLLRTHRSLTPSPLADLVLEVPEGFCAGKCIARSPANPAPDLRGLQLHGPLALLDLVPEELEAMPNMDDSGLPVCRVTPSLANIRVAASSAAWASPRVRHVTSQSSAYRVNR